MAGSVLQSPNYDTSLHSKWVSQFHFDSLLFNYSAGKLSLYIL